MEAFGGVVLLFPVPGGVDPASLTAATSGTFALLGLGDALALGDFLTSTEPWARGVGGPALFPNDPPPNVAEEPNTGVVAFR